MANSRHFEQPFDAVLEANTKGDMSIAVKRLPDKITVYLRWILYGEEVMVEGSEIDISVLADARCKSRNVVELDVIQHSFESRHIVLISICGSVEWLRSDWL